MFHVLELSSHGHSVIRHLLSRYHHAERIFRSSNAYHWNNGEFSSLLSSRCRIEGNIGVQKDARLQLILPLVKDIHLQARGVQVIIASLKTRAGVFGIAEKKFTARGSDEGGIKYSNYWVYSITTRS